MRTLKDIALRQSRRLLSLVTSPLLSRGQQVEAVNIFSIPSSVFAQQTVVFVSSHRRIIEFL